MIKLKITIYDGNEQSSFEIFILVFGTIMLLIGNYRLCIQLEA